jgi:heme/copper-type cytochrome/quinol oxidase subunit 3
MIREIIIVIIIKIILASIFLISGGICFANENLCSVSNNVSVAFILFGIGIVISGIFSIIAIVLLLNNENLRGILYFVVMKFLLGLIFIICGIITYFHRDITGCGLVGIGLGIIVSAFITSILVFKNMSNVSVFKA